MSHAQWIIEIALLISYLYTSKCFSCTDTISQALSFGIMNHVIPPSQHNDVYIVLSVAGCCVNYIVINAPHFSFDSFQTLLL